MKSILFSSIFWEAVSAIGTMLAVITSLVLARPRQKKKLDISYTMTRLRVKGDTAGRLTGDLEIAITIKNIGNVPIAIMEAGIKATLDTIDVTIDKYRTSAAFPLKVRAGELEIIRYYVPKYSKDFSYILKMISTEKLTVKDSEGHIY